MFARLHITFFKFRDVVFVTYTFFSNFVFVVGFGEAFILEIEHRPGMILGFCKTREIGR